MDIKNVDEQLDITLVKPSFEEELLSIITTISDDQISFSLTKELITTIFELFISNNNNTNIKQELQRYCQNIISEGENEHNNRTNMDLFQNYQDNVTQTQDNLFDICCTCFVSQTNSQENSTKTENNTNKPEQDIDFEENSSNSYLYER